MEIEICETREKVRIGTRDAHANELELGGNEKKAHDLKIKINVSQKERWNKVNFLEDMVSIVG